MENASKALIIAGAILISIMIVSLGVLIFNKMGNSAKEAANMDEQEIANFNSKLTPYIGQNISGSQVNALIQLLKTKQKEILMRLPCRQPIFLWEKLLKIQAY